MTMRGFGLLGLAASVALAACGEEGVSIGRGQCPNLPLYDVQKLAVERTSSGGYRTIINPNVERDAGPATIARLNDLIDTLNEAASRECITALGGAVTDENPPSGTGGQPSIPDAGSEPSEGGQPEGDARP